jgi:hypothetical protein
LALSVPLIRFTSRVGGGPAFYVELSLFDFMPTPEQNPKRSNQTDGNWLAIGISIGTALGVAFDNLGLWLSLGVAIGVCGGLFRGSGKKTD